MEIVGIDNLASLSACRSRNEPGAIRYLPAINCKCSSFNSTTRVEDWVQRKLELKQIESSTTRYSRQESLSSPNRILLTLKDLV